MFVVLCVAVCERVRLVVCAVLAAGGLLVYVFAVDRERFRAHGATAWQ